MSSQTIKDRRGGWRKILSEWKNADGEHSTWWYKCGNAPKYQDRIAWVYWIVQGRIRWRCRLLEVHKNVEITFDRQSTPKFARAWLVLFDFEQIPRHLQTYQRGFQGFRYFNSEKIFN